jgi:hypothetical protein
MMIIKVCDGLPTFLTITEAEYQRTVLLLKDLEYYEIQNMLHYLLKSEDLLKGPFPRISLETIYINLYNISKLRDVEKVIDELETDGGSHNSGAPVDNRSQQTEKPASFPKKETAPYAPTVAKPAEIAAPPDVVPSVDDDGVRTLDLFVRFVKATKPFIGGMFETMEMTMQGDSITFSPDKKYINFIKNDMDEIKSLLQQYFGREIAVAVVEGQEKKRDLLEEYVKEAESLFNV